MNTIVPIVLVVVAAIWIYSQFGEPIKRFIEWIKSFTTSQKDRFQPRNVSGPMEFKYS